MFRVSPSKTPVKPRVNRMGSNWLCLSSTGRHGHKLKASVVLCIMMHLLTFLQTLCLYPFANLLGGNWLGQALLPCILDMMEPLRMTIRQSTIKVTSVNAPTVKTNWYFNAGLHVRLPVWIQLQLQICTVAAAIAFLCNQPAAAAAAAQARIQTWLQRRVYCPRLRRKNPKWQFMWKFSIGYHHFSNIVVVKVCNFAMHLYVFRGLILLF